MLAVADAVERRRARKTALARQAIEAYLAQDAPPASSPERPTVAELAGHLAGCLDGGLPDLSTNKKYMEGFGG